MHVCVFVFVFVSLQIIHPQGSIKEAHTGQEKHVCVCVCVCSDAYIEPLRLCLHAFFLFKLCFEVKWTGLIVKRLHTHTHTHTHIDR